MLSANALQQHHLAATASGADGYLAKPVTVASLVDGILDVLDSAAETPAEDAGLEFVQRLPA